MSKRPTRECIRAETLVDYRERTRDAGVAEGREIGFHLFRGQNAFIDQRPRRKTVEVQLRCCFFDAFANEVEFSFELVHRFQVWIAPDKDLLEDWFHRLCRIADRLIVRGHVAPPEYRLSGSADGGLNDFFAPALRIRIPRKEDHPDTVLTRRR